MRPDRWQALAVQALRAGKDVVVDAPTGAGKTYVFERWAEQTSFGRRALFTVPTRALANDKFAEWRVGITTGDVCADPGVLRSARDRARTSSTGRALSARVFFGVRAARPSRTPDGS